jgi:hypothetical protein
MVLQKNICIFVVPEIRLIDKVLVSNQAGEHLHDCSTEMQIGKPPAKEKECKPCN